MKTVRQIIERQDSLTRISDQELRESLVGKGAVISNNRQHSANKTKLLGALSQIQNDCRHGVNEEDQIKKIDLLFQVAFQFAGVLKIFGEMSANTNNVSTIGVLDTENIQKEISKALLDLRKR